jgi:hypothetical protein
MRLMTSSDVPFEIENEFIRQSFVGFRGRIELQEACVKGAHWTGLNVACSIRVVYGKLFRLPTVVIWGMCITDFKP